MLLGIPVRYEGKKDFARFSFEAFSYGAVRVALHHIRF